MRVFHLETIHFGEIHFAEIHKNRWPTCGDQHLILVFGLLILDKSNISAFQKCHSSGCFNYLVAQGSQAIDLIVSMSKPW